MRCFKNIFILLLCSVTTFCFAQKEDRNWVFGDSIRIDFNNLSNPTVHHANCYNNESNASISDRNGLLEMYLSTKNYWGTGSALYGIIVNKQNSLMENGDSILHYYSATNGALFIPVPNDSLKYYFFSTGINTSSEFLSYSIIDLSFNGGLGKVISKNNLLTDSVTEHLMAVRHGNGRDWWLITKKLNSNLFVKYLITPSGISTPYFQPIGSVYYRNAGECAVTVDGSKLCFSSEFRNFDVFDFDRCSGEISNWLELGEPPYNQPDVSGWKYYGCEFSPDGNRLYATKFNESPIQANIFQLTLNIPTVLSSKTNILSPVSNYVMGQIQLAPNGKIYISGQPGPGFLDSSYKYLSIINSPDDSGTASGLNLFSIYLSGRHSFLGLPNMPHYNLTSLDGSACDTLGIDALNNIQVIQQSLLNIYPNPATNELTIEILNGIAPKQIEITSSLGVTFMQLHQTKPNQQLNIKQLTAGVYFVKVKMQDGNVTVRKFIKL